MTTTQNEVDRLVRQLHQSRYGQLRKDGADKDTAFATKEEEILHATSTITKLIEKAALEGRVKEHDEWVLYYTEAAHSWEQDGEGSGIQYFDNERLDRYKQLKSQLQSNNEEVSR